MKNAKLDFNKLQEDLCTVQQGKVTQIKSVFGLLATELILDYPTYTFPEWMTTDFL